VYTDGINKVLCWKLLKQVYCFCTATMTKVRHAPTAEECDVKMIRQLVATASVKHVAWRRIKVNNVVEAPGRQRHSMRICKARAPRIYVNNASRNEAGEVAVPAFVKHAASQHGNDLCCLNESWVWPRVSGRLRYAPLDRLTPGFIIPLLAPHGCHRLATTFVKTGQGALAPATIWV
jgi:hypothetical protein